MWKVAWACSLFPPLLCREFMDLCAGSVTRFTVLLSGVFYWRLGSFPSHNFKSFVTSSEKSFQITPSKVDSPCTYFYNHKNNMYMLSISSVQSLSYVWLFMTPWTAACQASLSITNSQFTQTQLHWVGDAIQPSHPLLLPSPAFNLSQHQGLLNESALCIRWTKYWSFSFNISLSKEHSGLIFFRLD